MDAIALETLQRRATEAGISNLSLVNANVEQYSPNETYDVVTGRHILIHTRDPLAVMQSALRLLSSGGIAAFQEYDFTVKHHTYPACPFRDRVYEVFHHVFNSMSMANIGTQLFNLFTKAGFKKPNCRVEYPLEGGPDTQFYEWFAESFRAVYPRLQALGMADGLDVNLDTLADQLREEAVTNQACVPGPTMVSGFASRP